MLTDAPREKRVTCPHCKHSVVYYRRSIYRTTARWLCWLVRQRERHGDGWWHVDDYPPGLKGGDYAKLRFWGFVEPMPGKCDPSKTSSGCWRALDAGADFAYGRTDAPEYVWTFENTLYAISDTRTTILDSMGRTFDIRDVLTWD